MAQPIPITAPTTRSADNSRHIVLKHAANELVFAVVGHIGAGTSLVAANLQNLLKNKRIEGKQFEVHIVKARTLLTKWAATSGEAIPEPPAGVRPDIKYTSLLQDVGDNLRRSTNDNAAVARLAIQKIREIRAERIGHDAIEAEKTGKAVIPDGNPRAYIIDSIRNPTEVELLRHVYQEAFVLIGVVCESDRRLNRLSKKFRDGGVEAASEIMQRDSRAPEKFGQRVLDAFHMSDFFVDNTEDEKLSDDDTKSNPHWDVPDRLSRLLKIVLHEEVTRPTVDETAMYHAHIAAMRSACLSRQVGAALVDRHGEIVATGTNEVPRAGGGVYGEKFGKEEEDHRCAYQTHGGRPFCSNTVEQNRIVDDLIADIDELKSVAAERKEKIRQLFLKGRIGDLLEFSRAVHAEMDAIISATRQGVNTIGTRMYVTTFPCHYCARHIVAAGIDEVQFIEPYVKSQALQLHSDSIQTRWVGWIPPSLASAADKSTGKMPKVLFRPFSGIAPRMYRRAFFKDRELKDGATGTLKFSEPDWGVPWHLRSASYVQLEAALSTPPEVEKK